VDTVHCNPIADITRTTKEVCNLARVLSKVDPTTFGLLKCRGIIKGSETITDRLGSPKELPTFTFVFDISPELSNPRSLRSILQKATPYALNERFELARQLTHSILYVHTARFVHKNIRPETIVVFENEKSKIGASFLLGFEKFRQEDGQTYWAGDGLWEQNLCMSSIPKQLPSNHRVRFRHSMSRSGDMLDFDFDF
jgi:serine/threonine protein kinase